MAGSVNKVILVGNLGRDPEIRYTQSNQKIVHLSIATSENWKDRQSGERREKTEWHRVVIFNENLADIAERFLQKGRTVYVEGQLQTRKWQDQNGQDRYSTEIVLSRFRGELTLLGGGRGDEGGGPMGDDMGGFGGDYDDAGPSGGGYAGGRSQPARGGAQPAGGSQSRRPSVADDLDDDIPF
ncbi:single-strand binding protein [Arboricoccus pini]|uniref:Single-stranded DNA-binding protein n=1 Tax=Arboricoccus pini TaxID=1963835 RepID=A0A212PXT3_9PROT|nr:single-stranded DNA-binding protein [Arboricoccus pini]SNB51905.1 single-strand binding protein [Arboricoccus pini]